jgi:hypothetical protein
MTYYGRKINIVLIKNRAIVLLVSALFGWGIYIAQENPIDAILIYQKIRLLFYGVDGRSPQVIVKIRYYPLALIYRVFLKSKYPGFFHV